MLIIPARNDDHLLMEGTQTRNGPRGAGGDGIVIIFDPIQLANEFDAVLYPAELPRNFYYRIGGNISPHRADGGEIIFHVVRAGNPDRFLRHDFAGASVFVIADDSLRIQISTVFGRLLPAEEYGLTAHLFRKSGGR